MIEAPVSAPFAQCAPFAFLRARRSCRLRRRGARTRDIQAQHRLDHGRRPRLRRPRRVRPNANPDAASRPHGGGGHTLYRRVCGLYRLRAVEKRADDGTAHRPYPRAAQRLAGSARCRRDRGGTAQRAGLCDGADRQVGSGHGRFSGRPVAAGLRPLLRLSEPGACAQLLSAVLDAHGRPRAPGQRGRSLRPLQRHERRCREAGRLWRTTC